MQFPIKIRRQSGQGKPEAEGHWVPNDFSTDITGKGAEDSIRAEGLTFLGQV